MAKNAKIETRDWKPDPYDAMNLAALRYYSLEIEQLCISIYAGDDKKRTKFAKLQTYLGDFVKELRREFRQPLTAREVVGVRASDCYDSWVMCSGNCVPPGFCDRVDSK